MTGNGQTTNMTPNKELKFEAVNRIARANMKYPSSEEQWIKIDVRRFLDANLSNHDWELIEHYLSTEISDSWIYWDKKNKKPITP